MMKNIVYICMALFLLMSCVDSAPKYDSKIIEAYNLVRGDADSALRVLQKMNIEDFDKEHDKAYYAYVYTATLYWLNAHALNDSLVKVAVDYYSVNGDSAMKAKTFYYAAKVYESLRDRQQAVSYFNQALENTPADSVNLKLYIYSDWAFMIKADRPDEESYELYERVKEYAKKLDSKIHSNHHYADALLQQGWINLVNHEYDKAIVKYKEANDFIVKNGMDYMRFTPLNRLAHCYMEEGNTERAMFYAKEAERYAENVTQRRNINSTLANIYIKTNELDRAINCLKLAADTSDNHKRFIYYRQLWDLYLAKGDYKAACEYGKKHMKYRDKSYVELLNNNASEHQARYNEAELESHKTELDLKAKQLRLSLVISVLAVAVVVIVLLLFMYMRKLKMMEMLRIKDDTIAEASSMLQVKINELQELRTQLSENTDKLEVTRRQRQELKLRIFEMNEVVRKINEFKKVRNKELVGQQHILIDEELNVLSEMTDFLQNGIMTKLSAAHAMLTKGDKHLCCLLSLGFSGSKIAHLLGISEDALKKRKSRLLHTRLNVPEEFESLEDYLNYLKRE